MGGRRAHYVCQTVIKWPVPSHTATYHWRQINSMPGQVPRIKRSGGFFRQQLLLTIQRPPPFQHGEIQTGHGGGAVDDAD
jgi:hypothetical protein